MHLSGKRHRQELERYDVKHVPTVLLLDSSGKVLKEHRGFMNDIAFCNNFLETSATDSLDAP